MTAHITKYVPGSAKTTDSMRSWGGAGMAAAGIEPQGPPDIKEFPVHEMIGA